jgi:integrase
LDPQTIGKKEAGVYWDEGGNGLYLQVSPKGKRTFAIRYRFPKGGQQRRKTLGTFHPQLFPLAKARQIAREARNDIDAGKDPFPPPEPAETQENDRGEYSFKAMAETVLEEKEATTRPKTQILRRQLYERFLEPRFGHLHPKGVTRAEVKKLHQEVGRDHPVMANRTLALLQLIFNYGIGELEWPDVESNPAHLVKRLPEETRDRCLEIEEIKVLWGQLYEEHPYVAGALRVALLTGQRIRPVRELRWEQIKGQTWRIPKEVFKGKREHWVPLSPEVQEILGHYQDIGSAWVFPAARGGGGHVVRTELTVRRVWKANSLERFTAHDFRTTFNTWATRPADSTDPDVPAGLGVHPDVADAVLGHKDPRLSLARYHGRPEEYRLAEKRDALTKWGAFVRANVDWREDWR